MKISNHVRVEFLDNCILVFIPDCRQAGVISENDRLSRLLERNLSKITLLHQSSFVDH